jgi:hypothetical protein
VTAAIMFLSGLVATVGGALLRSCGAGIEADLTRYWCGPQQHVLAPGQAHCAGCETLAAGFILMIAALVVASLSRRHVARAGT